MQCWKDLINMDALKIICMVLSVVQMSECSELLTETLKMIDTTGPRKRGYGHQRAVAMNDKLVVVGAYNYEPNRNRYEFGKALVYTRIGVNINYTSATVLWPDPNFGDRRWVFGKSVAINNDFIVIGAATHPGTVFVFSTTYPYKKLFQQTKRNKLGSTVAISKDTNDIVAGYEDGKEAYVFSYTNSTGTPTWSSSPQMISLPEQMKDQSGKFSGYVAISKKHLLISAYAFPNNHGTVFSYTKDNDQWVLNQTIPCCPGGLNLQGFGKSFVLDGDRLIVGVSTKPGYIFEYSLVDGKWKYVRQWRRDEAGRSMAIHKNVLVVGAEYSGQFVKAGGLAYVFEFNVTRKTWVEVARLKPKSLREWDMFGQSVAVRGNLVLAGSNDGSGSPGAVYAFDISGLVTQPEPVQIQKPKEQPNSSNFSLTCHELYFDAYWNKRQFGAALNYSIYLRDTACNAFSQNETHIWLRSNFSECGALVSENEAVIKQKNTAMISAVYFQNGIIKKEKHFEYNIYCQFDRHLNVSTETAFNVTKTFRKKVVDVGGAIDFKVEMNIFTNQMFNEIAPDPFAVSSAQPLYIGITEKNKNPLFRFVVHTCHAAPANAHHEVLYMFLYDKCAVDASFRLLLTDTNNYNFRIEAFEFLSYQLPIYLHCTLYICPRESSGGACNQTCARERVRRDVTTSYVEDIPSDDVHLKSQKIVYKPARTCKQVSCPKEAVCIDAFPALCRCRTGFVQVEGACSKERIFMVSHIHIDLVFLPEYEDHTSLEYITLVTFLESELMQMIQKRDNDTVTMIAVTDVRRGSIIVDANVVHKKATTKEKAFLTVRETIMDNMDSNNTLRFIRGKIPVMVSDDDDEHNALLIRILVVIGIMFAVVVILLVNKLRGKWRRGNSKSAEVEGTVNAGVSLDNMN